MYRISYSCKLVAAASLLIAWGMIPALDAVAQSPDNDERVGQKWAVLIGVNDYGEMKDLTQCRNDVEGLERQLIASGFHPDNIVLLADGAEQQRHLPFKANIERQLQLVLGGVDQLLCLKATHSFLHLSGWRLWR